MTEIRVRGLREDVVDYLKRSADRNGRSLESEVRHRLEGRGRSHTDEFPSAADWLQAGFDEIFEVVKGSQYIAYARLAAYRVSLTRSMLSDTWHTEIEESIIVEGATIWARTLDVAARLSDDSAAAALRDCIRCLAEHAGVDAVSQLRAQAGAYDNLPINFQQASVQISQFLGSDPQVRPRQMMIWHTSLFDVYVNLPDANSVAVMVYKAGQAWSITNGKAAYFTLDGDTGTAITRHLDMLFALNRKAEAKASR